MPQFILNAARTDFANVFTAVQTMPINGLVVGTNQLVASGGFIGVGTATPACLITASSNGSTDPRGIMSAQYSTDVNGARFQLRKARGTEASPVVIVTGDSLGKVRFSGYDGSNYLQMGSIDVIATGTVASTRVPTYMVFSTATDAAPSVLSESFRIYQNQNVGFGTGPVPFATPSTKVVIQSVTEQLRVNYSEAIYTSFTVASTGRLTLQGVGGSDAGITINPASTKSAVLNFITSQRTGAGNLAYMTKTGVANNAGAIGSYIFGLDSTTRNIGMIYEQANNNLSLVSDTTNSDAFTFTRRISITTTGTVIIGSTGAPLEKFDVYAGNQCFSNISSTATQRRQFMVTPSFVVNTDASFTTRGIIAAFDAASPTTGRECIRVESSGTAAMCGFFGAAAVVRPAGTGETVGFTAGGGTAVTDSSTFTGNVGSTAYRLSDVVKALKNLGLMAA